MNLVTDFERLDGHEDLRALISSLEQRMDAMDNMCSRLEREAEKERNQTQQYLSVIEDQTRELDKLRVALRTVEDEASQERERQHVLIARLRASVRFYNRFCVFRVMLIVLMKFLVIVGLTQFRKSNDVPRSSSSKRSSDLERRKVQEQYS
jgi:hypothetical protein